jgi:hypothetical protein
MSSTPSAPPTWRTLFALSPTRREAAAAGPGAALAGLRGGAGRTPSTRSTRGAISVTERAGFIKRVRDNARASAEAYLRIRAKLGFPLVKTGWTVGEQPPPLEGAPASASWATFRAEPDR